MGAAAALRGTQSRLELLLACLAPLTDLSAAYVGEKHKYTPVFVLLQVAAFAVLYLLMRGVSQPRAKRAEFTSSCVSLMHNAVSILLAGPLVWQARPFHFDDHGTLDMHIVLQYSVAYMIVDLACFLLPYTPTDYLFVGHHFATGLYMWDCIDMQRGAVTVLPWLVVGEATGPLLNTFTVAKTMRKTGSKFWQGVFSTSSPLFTVAFILVRTIGMPALYVWWMHGLLTDCPAIGMGHKAAWILLVTAGALGSQVWSYKLIQGFFRTKRKKLAAAAKAE